MNRFKIAFFDIDGTLIDMNRKVISQNTVHMLRRLREKGILTCVATGRSPMGLSSLNGIPFDVYMTYNGSLCYTDEDILYSNPLLREDILAILRNASGINRPMAVASADRIAANGSDKDLEEYFSFSKLKLEIATDFERLIQEDIYQIMLGCRRADYGQILEGTRNARIAAWWDRAVDIIPAGSGKGEGIGRILRRLHIDPAEAIAFGDGDNDIEMLQTVGCGVAMENASYNLKAVADAVCGHVAEDGVFRHCLEKGLI